MGKPFNLNTDNKITEMYKIVSEIGHKVNGDHPSWLLDSINIPQDVPTDTPSYILPKVINSLYTWRPVRFVKSTRDGYYYSNNTVGGLHIQDGKCTGGYNNTQFEYVEITRDEYIDFYYNIALKYLDQYGDSNEN